MTQFVPYVAIKLGRMPAKRPLIQPTTIPIKIPIRAATGMDIPAFKSCAQIHPINPAVAPTDKSIPPVSKTAVSPALNTKSTLACRNIVIRLFHVLKLGAMIADMITKIIKPTRL